MIARKGTEIDRTRWGLCLVVVLCTCPRLVFGCPLIDRFVDLNCDQRHRVSITGDSIVKGVGDAKRDDDGGYVARLGEYYPGSEFVNIGIPGISSSRLLRDFKQNLNKPAEGTTKVKTRDIDQLIIQVGTNDYWERNPAALTVRNIKRLVKFLRTKLEEMNGTAPVIGIATLPPTRRDFQNPFIHEVNSLLLKFNSSKLPVRIRFDTLPTRYISFDDLHPSSKGYNRMAKVVKKYVRGVSQKDARQRVRDSDDDGIYDQFEARYGTDSSLSDTDGDGVLDGDEVFVTGTDPLDPGSF